MDNNISMLPNLPTAQSLPIAPDSIGNDFDLKGYTDAPRINPNIELYQPSYENKSLPFIESLRRSVLSDLNNFKANFGGGDTLTRIASMNNNKIDITGGFATQSQIYDTLNNGDLTPKYESYLPGVDNDARLSRQQSSTEKLLNPVGRFLTKVGRGAPADIASFVYGIGEAAVYGRAESIFDNEFAKYVDDLDKKTDFAYKNYYSKQQSDLGFNSYTWDKALGGAEFTARMIGSEALIAAATGGASLPASLGRRFAQIAVKTGMVADKISDVNKMGKYAANVIRTMQKPLASTAGKGMMDTVMTAGKLGEAVNIGNQAARLGNNLKMARFAITGSMYESGFEARHYAQEAKQDFWDYHKQNGTTPTADEVANIDRDIEKASWGVFAANMGILSVSNIALFGRMLNIKNPIARPITDSFFDRNIAKIGVKAGADGLFAPLKAGIANKAVAYAKPFAKGVFWEGVFEEGNQGIASNMFKNYVASSYDKEAMKNTNNYIDAFAKAFHDQYNTKAGVEEIVIGGIIGGLFGGVGGIRETSGKYRNAQNQAKVLNSAQNKIEETVGRLYTNENLAALLSHNNRIQAISENSDNTTDSFSESLSTVEGIISLMDASYSVGKDAQSLEMWNASIDGMDANEIASNYGVSLADAQDMKTQWKTTLNEISQDYAKFREFGGHMFSGKLAGAVDPEGKVINPENLASAYAYMSTMGKFAERTAGEAFSKFQDKLAQVTTNKNFADSVGTIAALQVAGEHQKREYETANNEFKKLEAEYAKLSEDLQKLNPQIADAADIKNLDTNRVEVSNKMSALQDKMNQAQAKKDTAWKAISDNFFKKLGTTGYLPQVDLETFNTQMEDLRDSYDQMEMDELDRYELDSLLETFNRSRETFQSFNKVNQALLNPEFTIKTYSGLFANKRAQKKSVNDLTKEVYLELQNFNTGTDELINEYSPVESPVTDEIVANLDEKDSVEPNDILDFIANKINNRRRLTENEQKVYDKYKQTVDDKVEVLREKPIENNTESATIAELEIKKNALLTEIENIKNGNDPEVKSKIDAIQKEIDKIDETNAKLLEKVAAGEDISAELNTIVETKEEAAPEAAPEGTKSNKHPLQEALDKISKERLQKVMDKYDISNIIIDEKGRILYIPNNLFTPKVNIEDLQKDLFSTDEVVDTFEETVNAREIRPGDGIKIRDRIVEVDDVIFNLDNSVSSIQLVDGTTLHNITKNKEMLVVRVVRPTVKSTAKPAEKTKVSPTQSVSEDVMNDINEVRGNITEGTFSIEDFAKKIKIKNKYAKSLFNTISKIADKFGVKVVVTAKELGKGIANYDPITNTVNLNMDLIQKSYIDNVNKISRGGGLLGVRNIQSFDEYLSYVLNHELIHSVTALATLNAQYHAQDRVKHPLKISKTQFNAILKLNEIHKYLSESDSSKFGGKEYAFENMHELMAEMANEGFVDILRTIELPKKLRYDSSTKTVFENILKLLKDFFTGNRTLNDNAADNIMHIISDIMAEEYTGPVYNVATNLPKGSTEREIVSKNKLYRIKEVTSVNGIITYTIIDNKTGEIKNFSQKQTEKYIAEFISVSTYPDTIITEENASIELGKDIAENSNNPREIADMLKVVPRFLSEEVVGTKEWVIAQNIKKTTEKSFKQFGDENNITNALARTYFGKNSEKTYSIDQIAALASAEFEDEIGGDSITTDDVIEFMMKYPNDPTKAERPDNEVYEALVDRFVTLTAMSPTENFLKQILGNNTAVENINLKDRMAAEEEYNNLSLEEQKLKADEYDDWFNNLSPEEQENEYLSQLTEEEIDNYFNTLEENENQKTETSTDTLDEEGESDQNDTEEQTTESTTEPEKSLEDVLSRLESKFKSDRISLEKEQEKIINDAVNAKNKELDSLNAEILKLQILELENKIFVQIAQELASQPELTQKDIRRGDLNRNYIQPSPTAESKAVTFKNKDAIQVARIIALVKQAVEMGKVYTTDDIDKLLNTELFNKAMKFDKKLWKSLKPFLKDSGTSFTFTLEPTSENKESYVTTPFGYYDYSSHSVVINIGNIIAYGGVSNDLDFVMGELYTTMVHEGLHAATLHAIVGKNNGTATDEEIEAVETIESLFARELKRFEDSKKTGVYWKIEKLTENLNKLQEEDYDGVQDKIQFITNEIKKLKSIDEIDRRLPYGLTNVEEFIANIAGPEFRFFLANNSSNNIIQTILKTVGIKKNSTVDEIVKEYSRMRDSYFNRERRITELSTSDDATNAIAKRYEDIENAVKEHEFSNKLQGMYSELNQLRREHSALFENTENQEDVDFESMDLEQRLDWVMNNTDFLIRGSDGRYSPNLPTQEEIDTFRELHENEEFDDPEYDDLKRKMKRAKLMQIDEFGDATVMDLIELQTQLRNVSMLNEIQTTKFDKEEVEKLLNSSYKQIKNSKNSPVHANVYEGAYISTEGKTKTIHHIKLHTIIEKALAKGLSVQIDKIETMRDKKGAFSDNTVEQHEVDYANAQELADRFDKEKNVHIRIVDFNNPDYKIALIKGKNQKHFEYAGDILGLLDLKAFKVSGQATTYNLLYEENVDGTLSPKESEFYVSIDGVMIPFDEEEIDNLTYDDEIEYVYDPLDDYNKTLKKEDRIKKANIQIRSNGKLVGMLKSSDVKESNKAWSALHDARRRVINAYDRGDATIKDNVKNSIPGLPRLTLDNDGSPIKNKLNNNDVVGYGYVDVDGKHYFENDGYAHYTNYTEPYANSQKIVPFAVIKQGAKLYTFPIEIKPKNVSRTAIAEFDEIYNREGLSKAKKMLYTNALLAKYGLDDKSIYWTYKRDSSDTIRERLKDARETVNVKSFSQVKRAVKYIPLDMSRPFMMSKIELYFPPGTGEKISDKAYSKFKEKGIVHSRTLESIEKLVQEGKELTERQLEIYMAKKGSLSNSIKIKPDSEEGAQNAELNMC